jgi:hypothetical protein
MRVQRRRLALARAPDGRRAVTLTRSLKNVPSALQRSGTIDPSSMSNHACVSDATAYELGAHFPDQGARHSAMEAEAADSRRYAGICSRFDAEAGLRIARQVADLALNSDVRGNAAFALP